MSLLAGLSQQGDSISAHNADAGAHGAQIAATVDGHNKSASAHSSQGPFPVLRKVKGRSIVAVAIGDSLCSGNTFTPDIEPNPTGWGEQVSWMSNGGIRLRKNAGIPSETTTQMLARVAASVGAYSPEMCFILGGRNDINAAVPTNTIVANIEAIAVYCVANNILPIIGLVPPSAAGATAAVLAINAAISDLCANKGYPLADTYTPYITSGGAQVASLFADSLHFNEAGAKVAGAEFLRAAGWYNSGCSYAPFSTALTGNLVTNPLFSGAVSGSPGTLPTGWTKSGNPTLAYTVEAGVTWCTMTSADGGDVYLFAPLGGVVLTPSARFFYGCRLKNTTSTANGYVSVYVQTHAATYQISKLFVGTVENINGVTMLESDAIAANTDNAYIFKVKGGVPGASLKFATPFLYQL